MSDEPPNLASRTHDVFVSYASQDVALADAIVAALEKNGLKCWIAPRDVRPGALYADGIIRAINDAKVMVLVLSANSIASKHVGKEVERASSKGRPIITLKVDAAPLTTALEHFLSESQWIDATAPGMPATLSKLAQAVRQGLAASPGVNPVLGTGLTAPGTPGTNRPIGGKRVALAAAILLASVVAVALGVHFWPSKHSEQQAPDTAAAISDKSIAVLPFADMSQKKDQEYFGDGMAEEILDLLAKIPGLTVVGRTSSFQFKGKNEDLRTIGAKLNAAYVLEGSVRNSGDQVRITAQLINTKTGAHEWSETYDRPIGDVLKLQDAIAAAVARELQLTVAPGYLSSRSTVKDSESYDLMLRGRHSADRFDRRGLDEAITLFKQVLDRDPTSADAAAELAFAYYAEGNTKFLPPAAAFEQARRAAETALTLNAKSALAHYVLGKIHIVYDWDWTSADREFQEIATIAPGSAYTLSGEALLSLALGRWDGALRQIQASLALDPLDPDVFQNLMEIELGRGHLPEAEAAIRRSLDISPTYGYGHFLLGFVKLLRGDANAALLEMQQESTEDGRQEGFVIVYFELGRRAESDAALARMLKERADMAAYSIAVVYAFRRQTDEAMRWLDRAYAQKDAFLPFAKAELSQTILAADPRFKAFLRKMNLPE
jgi:TolB-like protein/Flp pilus assembly protein TadD